MSTSPTSARRLLCQRCGRSTDVTPDELLDFSRGRWPRCCAEVMSLSVDDRSVSPQEDTDLERPRRSRKMFPG